MLDPVQQLDQFRQEHGGGEVPISEDGNTRLFADGAQFRHTQGAGIIFQAPPDSEWEKLQRQIAFWSVKVQTAKKLFGAMKHVTLFGGVAPNWNAMVLGKCPEFHGSGEVLLYLKRLHDTWQQKLAAAKAAFDDTPEEKQRRERVAQMRREFQAEQQRREKERSEIESIVLETLPAETEGDSHALSAQSSN